MPCDLTFAYNQFTAQTTVAGKRAFSQRKMTGGSHDVFFKKELILYYNTGVATAELVDH